MGTRMLTAYHVLGNEFAHAVHFNDFDIARIGGKLPGQGQIPGFILYDADFLGFLLNGLVRRAMTLPRSNVFQDVFLGDPAFVTAAWQLLKLAHAHSFARDNIEHQRRIKSTLSLRRSSVLAISGARMMQG